MNSLHNLVVSGKVLYLVSHDFSRSILRAYQVLQGISDTPAWIVSKANLYARMTGKTPFVVYQGAWNVLQRDFERDIIPMAREEGECSYTCDCGDEFTMRQGWHWSRGTCLRAGKSAQTKRKKGVAARERKASGS